MPEGKKLGKDFLKRFLRDPAWNNVKFEFNRLFGSPIWLNIKELDKHTEALLKKKTKLPKACIKKTLDLIKKSTKTRDLEKRTCCKDRCTASFPVFIEDRNYGYILIIHFKKNAPKSDMNLLGQFINLLAAKAQRELELERLYETIGPRTLALSTIHTLHRAMSSNLNLDELLPRIGRLSLQVLGSVVCKIYLFDEGKNILTPKVNLNLKRIERNQTASQLEEEAAKQVAQTAAPIIKKDFVAVPLIEEEVLGVILISQKLNAKPFTYFDQDILSTLAEQAVIAIKNARLLEQQERLTLGSIRSLASLLKIKDAAPYSHRPGFKVMLSLLAKQLDLPGQEALALQNAALLHDIEKASIPDKILKKSKPLTHEEYSIIKEHPLKTVNIVEPLQSLESAIPIILHHHERFDGKGYPSGLKGKQIPKGARIMAVVDAFGAMVTERPWRKALSIEQAVSEIKKNSGTQFDPAIVESFLKVINNPNVKKKVKIQIRTKGRAKSKAKE